MDSIRIEVRLGLANLVTTANLNYFLTTVIINYYDLFIRKIPLFKNWSIYLSFVIWLASLETFLLFLHDAVDPALDSLELLVRSDKCGLLVVLTATGEDSVTRFYLDTHFQISSIKVNIIKLNLREK